MENKGENVCGEKPETKKNQLHPTNKLLRQLRCRRSRISWSRDKQRPPGDSDGTAAAPAGNPRRGFPGGLRPRFADIDLFRWEKKGPGRGRGQAGACRPPASVEAVLVPPGQLLRLPPLQGHGFGLSPWHSFSVFLGLVRSCPTGPSWGEQGQGQAWGLTFV